MPLNIQVLRLLADVIAKIAALAAAVDARNRIMWKRDDEWCSDSTAQEALRALLAAYAAYVPPSRPGAVRRAGCGPLCGSPA